MKLTDAEIKDILDEAMSMFGTNPSRIKYRKSSVDNTRKNYSSELKRLQSQLDFARSELKNVTFTQGETKNGNIVGSFAEKKINKRVNKVANLEARILEINGEINAEDYVSSRAIKLKNYMMENFLINSRTGYRELSAEAKEKMFDLEEEKKETIKEEEKLKENVSKLEKDVKDDIDEKVAANNAEVEKEREEEVDVTEVDNEEIQEEVNENFDEEAKSKAISESFGDYEEDNPISPISDIEPRKMGKVTPAKIAKGINDDIFNQEERDVPVVAKEREEKDYKKIVATSFIRLAELQAQIKATKDRKLVENLETSFQIYTDALTEAQTMLTDEEMIEVIESLPEEVREEIIVVSNNNENNNESVKEEVAEAVEETPVEVEQPVQVVEEPTVNQTTGAIEVGTAESINAVRMLQEQNQLLEEKEARVREEQESIAAKYEEARRQLLGVKKSLEESATARYEEIKKIERENARRTAELNAIFNAIDNSTKEDSSEKKK